MLLATTLERMGDQEGANEAFFDARALALGVPSVALHSELSFYEAQAAWFRRDEASLKTIVAEALAERPAPYDEAHAYPLQVSRAFMHELLGLTSAQRGAFRDQLAHLSAALSQLNELAYRDVWCESSLLDNLSALIADIYLPDVEKTVRARAQSLPWSPEVGLRAYNVHRALGWSAALRGDQVTALRDLREADVLAPSPAWRIEALLDRSYLFGELGESHAAHDRFDEAARLAQGIDWRSSEGEERYALLWLAEITAPYDAPRAEAVLGLYDSLKRPIDARFAAPTDQRLHGLRLDAAGAVSAAQGNTTRALAQLQEARDLWTSLGFEWRAAKTARALARVTNADDHVADARRRAAPWPQSWLARSA